MGTAYKPSFAEFCELAKEGSVVPVFTEELTDLLTAVTAYLRISANSTHSFLLESVQGGEKLGRYSFLGANPHKILKTMPTDPVGSDPLTPVENEFKDHKTMLHNGLPDFVGGVVGYIAYDSVRHFEPRVERPQKDAMGMPESYFMYFNDVVVFDHLKHTVKIVSNAFVNVADDEGKLQEKYNQCIESIKTSVAMLFETGPLQLESGKHVAGEMKSNFSQEAFEKVVLDLKKEIVNGEIIQAVPSQRMCRPTSASPFNVYRQLRSINPSPYLFYLDIGEFQIFGASPEALCKVSNGHVEMHPIAGTKKRGKTPEEDEANAKALLADTKETAEHAMLVDLGRNDVNRICRPETVRVSSLMHLEKYSHVMHIVSNVTGQLRDDKTSYDAFRSIFPAGTLSGAPKIRAVELVAEAEGELRGVYGGSVGWFGFNGNMDTAIAIRCMVHKDGLLYLQAGAGVVHDSNPTSEYEETVNKLMGNIRAIEAAERYEARTKMKDSGTRLSSELPAKKRKLAQF